MEKNFKRFTLAVYVLLMMAFYSLLTAGLGLIPGIVLTIAIVLLDARTFNSGATLLYAAVSLFSVPVFGLFAGIYERFSSNLPKPQASPENTDNFEERQRLINTPPVESNSEPKNNPPTFSTTMFSPSRVSDTQQQDESKVQSERSVKNCKA